MGRYLIKRVGWSILSLGIIATLTFFLLRFFPGGPFDADLALAPEIKQKMMAHYGADLSLGEQYLKYLIGLVSADLGISMYYPDQSVTSLLLRGLPMTFSLGVPALVLVFLGSVLSAALLHFSKQNVARGIRTFFELGLSLPTLLLGPLLLYFLSYKSSVFPLRVDGSFYSLILPCFIFGFRSWCSMSLLVSARSQKAMEHPSMRTLRSFGVSEVRLFFKYAQKSALLVLAVQAPALVAGFLSSSLLIETLFSIHGFGSLYLHSLLNRDWTLMLGLTLWSGSVYILVQMMSDVWVAIAEPRAQTFSSNTGDSL